MTVGQTQQTEKMTPFETYQFPFPISPDRVLSIQLADGWHNVTGAKQSANLSCLEYTSGSQKVYTQFNKIISVSESPYNK